jgi:hypothetical protein
MPKLHKTFKEAFDAMQKKDRVRLPRNDMTRRSRFVEDGVGLQIIRATKKASETEPKDG